METFILMIELWIEDVELLGIIFPVLFFVVIILWGIELVLNEERQNNPRVH